MSIAVVVLAVAVALLLLLPHKCLNSVDLPSPTSLPYPMDTHIGLQLSVRKEGLKTTSCGSEWFGWRWIFIFVYGQEINKTKGLALQNIHALSFRDVGVGGGVHCLWCSLGIKLGGY